MLVCLAVAGLALATQMRHTGPRYALGFLAVVLVGGGVGTLLGRTFARIDDARNR